MEPFLTQQAPDSGPLLDTIIAGPLSMWLGVCAVFGVFLVAIGLIQVIWLGMSGGSVGRAVPNIGVGVLLTVGGLTLPGILSSGEDLSADQPDPEPPATTESPAEQFDYSPLLNAAGWMILVVVALVVVCALVFAALRLRRIRRLTAASRDEQRARRDSALEQIAADEKTQMFWATDDWQVLSFPAFNDHSRPEVRTLVASWKRADTVRTDATRAGKDITAETIDRLAATADEFHSALASAIAMARHEEWGPITAEDRKQLTFAKQLLTTASDKAASATERELAVRSLHRVVTELKERYHQVIDLEAFRLAIETRAGLRAIEP